MLGWFVSQDVHCTQLPTASAQRRGKFPPSILPHRKDTHACMLPFQTALPLPSAQACSNLGSCRPESVTCQITGAHRSEKQAREKVGGDGESRGICSRDQSCFVPHRWRKPDPDSNPDPVKCYPCGLKQVIWPF